MLAALALLLLAAEEPPPAALPEGNALVRSLVTRQRHRDEALSRYTYDVDSVREELDQLSRITKRESWRHQIFFVRGRELRRLVARDGAALSAQQQAKQDREVQAKVAAIIRGAVITEQPLSRLSAMLLRYDFRAVSREDVAGRSAIVLEFRALPGRRTADGNLLGNLAGRFWVDEVDQEICRVELHNTDPIPLAKGFGSRLLELSSRWQFAKVDDVVWLPLSDEMLAEGRALLFRRFRVRFTRSYSRFRVFEAASDETIAPPD